MPAAAVIPAPIAYTKVVAVKKLVVEFLDAKDGRHLTGDKLALSRSRTCRLQGVNPIGDQLRGADLHGTVLPAARAARSLASSFCGSVARNAPSRRTALAILRS